MGLSTRGYAEHRRELGLSGGTHRAVQVALEEGRIPALDDGTIDPEAADVAWAENSDASHVRGNGRATEPKDGSLTDARIARERVRTERERLDLDRLRGELGSREEFDARAEKIARATRDRLAVIPTRIAVEFGVDDDERRRLEARIDEEIRTALEDLSEWGKLDS